MAEEPKPRKRPTPWWIYLLIGSFGSFFVLITYLQFLPLALRIEVGDSGKLLTVAERGAAYEAGLRPGDRIVSYDGHPFRNQVAPNNALVQSYQPGKPIVFEIERNGQRMSFSATPRRSFFAAGGIDPTAALLLYGRLALIFYLASGIALLLMRPKERLVQILGVAYLIVADFAWPVPAGFSAVFRDLPVFAQALLWIALFTGSTLLGTVGLWFSLTFPRSYLSKRWIWMLLAASLASAPMHASAIARVIYQPNMPAPFLFFLAWPAARVELILIGFAEAFFFALNYLHLEDVNERRRVRFVTVGMLMVLTSGIAYTGPVLFFPNSALTKWTSSLPSLVVLFTLFAAAPLVVAYGVVRHQLFDIRVIVRQGLQYGAARGVLKSIPILMGFIAGLDFSLHRQQTVGELLSQRGWVYGVLAVAAYLAHIKREQWLQALDRRFFRESYNAQQMLREVVEELRAARTVEEAAPRTVARIEAALHPEFATLMVREVGQPNYRSVAAAPSGSAPGAIASDSKLMAAFRLFAKPLEISQADSGWLRQQLPHSETEFLRQARIELLVPVAIAEKGREALLALGAKKSEEPYSAEDLQLLLAIAASLALLMERPAQAATAAGSEECPQCGTVYDSGMGWCSSDGIRLMSSRVPRLLTARYRLERRLGRGGMGTVYRALDMALERGVAIKLIRDELVANAEAAERFRREAKAAAVVSHPNLVTLHDYGVDAESRAYIVMELLEGATLRQELKTVKLGPRRTLEVLRGVCAGLDAAHEKGLVHRDLKPENVFLDRRRGGEVPKLLDFGLAKFMIPTGSTEATVDTSAGMLVGTASYMSPEQLRGGAPVSGWDLWALAVIAYEMLAGVYPFGDRNNLAAVHAAVLSGKATPISQYLPPSTGRHVETFFEDALGPDESGRPRSAMEFFKSCEAAIGAARLAAN